MPNKIKKTGNIGEWSEVYVFFCLLGEATIYPCNPSPVRTGTTLPVDAIFRGSEANTATYEYNAAEDTWKIIKKEGQVGTVSTQEAHQQAIEVLDTLLKKASGQEKSQASFSIPKAFKFLEYLHSPSIKAKSADKKDLQLLIQDSRSGRSNISRGFSIKSLIGKNPTLFNASKTSCFTYEVTNLSKNQVDEINRVAGQTQHIISKIKEEEGRINYVKIHPQFNKNLLFVDTSMPELLSHLVQEFFSDNKTAEGKHCKSIYQLLTLMAETDPRNWGKDSKDLYYYKIKKFLEASALGMVASKPWSGVEDANGGFIIVKPDGEIVTFHIYDRNEFMTYLLQNCYLDCPSLSRLKVGTLRYEQDKVFLELPLQVRYSRP
ncbi:MAG: HpaII family restriction endonuclease [Akkermansia sp.]|nr:HpaII family restriction endonuclease [Akkermansia sp.]